MRILVLSNEVWNDKVNGNNVTTNWFEGMNAEFANIYASPGEPFNNCCKTYYQITDIMMLKSIVKGIKAGKRLGDMTEFENKVSNQPEKEPRKLYSLLKSFSGHFLRLVRELLWLFGTYDIEELKRFIDEFKPDVIFSERMATCKMLRLEKIVSSLSDAPMFAFTGDDEYSLKQFAISPFFWINRFMIRRRLRENVKLYRVYYTLSEEQKKFYEKEFGCRCKILQKCGEFEEQSTEHIVKKPIKMIYAGKFYCNRWKVLGTISNALREINKDGVKITLEIYTRDKPTDKQKQLLNDGRNTFIRGPVSQEELKEIYRNGDIALHVESDDLKNRYLTRYSFSTKIIDCIFSGCAVMAYCWDQQSGWTYLKREDAAICVSSEKELFEVLREIVKDTSIISTYAQKAKNCGENNHNRTVIQKRIMDDFSDFIVKQN